MYSSKQQAINHYVDSMGDSLGRTYNKVDEVVWVSSDKMLAILKEQELLK